MLFLKNDQLIGDFTLRGWGRQRGRGNGASAPPRCPVLPRLRGGAGRGIDLHCPVFEPKCPVRVFWTYFPNILPFLTRKMVLERNFVGLLLFFVKFFQKIREFYKQKLFCSRALELYIHGYQTNLQKMTLRST